MHGFGNVRRLTMDFGPMPERYAADESEADDNPTEERAENTPRTKRTSFGVNQGDQRAESAAALEKKADESKSKFLRETEAERALKATAARLRGR